MYFWTLANRAYPIHDSNSQYNNHKKTSIMREFLHVNDIGDLNVALKEAQEIKQDRYKFEHLGHHHTVLLIFFNNSLRTRLSTQKAARNLGLDVVVLDVNQGAWKLETERGVIMDGDKSEHLLEAIPVMASYCDLIGVRTFAGLSDREADYTERILMQFMKYSNRPVFSMESATAHPLQAFADLITIEEHKEKKRPKVVLTWAPHPRALPQAVPNSFAEWMRAADVDFVVTHPKGYELDPSLVSTTRYTLFDNPAQACEGAHLVSTDVWTSMGYEKENAERLKAFDGFIVDGAKMARAAKDALFMHCLPAHRGEEVAAEVIDGPQSVVWDEAENRLHVQKALIEYLLLGRIENN